MGFSASKTDVSLFYYSADGCQVFLLVYVDDIIMMGSNATLISTLLGRLATAFKIRDLGKPRFFLGIETVDTKDGMILSQRRYMTDLLNCAGMVDCKQLAMPASTTQAVTSSDEPFDNPTQYRRIVGALQLVKRVLRYIKGTLDYGLRLSSFPTAFIHAYSDSDWTSCPIDRKNTSGYAVFLGTNLISWLSRKQRTVARSST
ncbi:PREDICTED: uncharacterized protein LOC109156527 [Ipomoea nil]|uniref:uncharacterized protein LOC109156527 n=1 Tax=Ipomoea nil TaxID=35883 RepID=UPI0009012B18|nr:PREDICTED: uncharacterized protein LOC109156527 [Ipomoea nil]